MGEECLAVKFSRLYSISSSKDAKVAELGVWSEGVCCWRLNWRRRLFTWEEECLENLMQVLHQCPVQQSIQDSWSWEGDSSAVYSVSSAYKLLSQVGYVEHQHFFKALWDSKYPLKVIAFCWKASLNRIPTAINLHKRGLQVVPDLLCHFCKTCLEETDHIFLSCSFSHTIWMLLYNWFGVDVVLQADIKSHFLQHLGIFWFRK